MKIQCDSIQDELMSLLYEGEAVDPAVRDHVKACSQCSATVGSYQKVQGFFQNLPEVSPPPRLTDAIYEKISTPQKKVVGGFWRMLLLHPASVAAIVFVLTLSGTLYVKKYFPWLPRKDSSQTAVALKDTTMGAPAPSGSEEMAGAPVAAVNPMIRSNVRMVDWNPMPHLIADLDRPVLRHTDLPSLEQATVESICAFKQHIALRHIMDGDYAKADQILDWITDNYLNYSNWDQAVIMHMNLMKKLGRTNEIQRDVARLKEYAMASPEILSEIQDQIR